MNILSLVSLVLIIVIAVMFITTLYEYYNLFKAGKVYIHVNHINFSTSYMRIIVSSTTDCIQFKSLFDDTIYDCTPETFNTYYKVYKLI